MKRLSIVAISIVLTACASDPVITANISQSGTESGLAAMQRSGFDKAFVRPGTVLADYAIATVDALDLNHSKVTPPPGARELMVEPWSLTDKRKTQLQALWGRANPPMALSTPGKKPLRVRAKLTQIAPSSNIEALEKAGQVVQIYTENSGNLGIELELIDAQNGELIAVLRDDREAGVSMWQQTSSIRVRQDYLWLFKQWRRHLEDLLK